MSYFKVNKVWFVKIKGITIFNGIADGLIKLNDKIELIDGNFHIISIETYIVAPVRSIKELQSGEEASLVVRGIHEVETPVILNIRSQ